jgi:hypothetical protein
VLIIEGRRNDNKIEVKCGKTETGINKIINAL